MDQELRAKLSPQEWANSNPPHPHMIMHQNDEFIWWSQQAGEEKKTGLTVCNGLLCGGDIYNGHNDDNGYEMTLEQFPPILLKDWGLLARPAAEGVSSNQEFDSFHSKQHAPGAPCHLLLDSFIKLLFASSILVNTCYLLNSNR